MSKVSENRVNGPIRCRTNHVSSGKNEFADSVQDTEYYRQLVSPHSYLIGYTNRISDYSSLFNLLNRFWRKRYNFGHLGLSSNQSIPNSRAYSSFQITMILATMLNTAATDSTSVGITSFGSCKSCAPQTGMLQYTRSHYKKFRQVLKTYRFWTLKKFPFHREDGRNPMPLTSIIRALATMLSRAAVVSKSTCLPPWLCMFESLQMWKLYAGFKLHLLKKSPVLNKFPFVVVNLKRKEVSA